PFSRIATSRLPESSCWAVCAAGLKTVTPASLMNDVVMMKKISKLMQKSSIGARSMPWSAVSGEWRRDCMFSPFRCGSLGRRERDVVDSAEVHLVDHLHERARRRGVLSDDQNTGFGIDGAHALDVGPDGPDVDGAVVDPDLAVLEDLNLNALRI